jgi:lysophospholipase L1-like esterase
MRLPLMTMSDSTSVCPQLLAARSQSAAVDSPNPAPTQTAGHRRQLLLVLLILVGLVYAPRLPRMETYLLVTTKRPLALAPAAAPWRAQLEQSLARLEQVVESPSQLLQSISASAASRINQSLELTYCAPATVSRLVRTKALNPAFVLPGDFKRICQAPLSREAERQLKQSGLTADGRLLLKTGDRIFIAGDSLMQGPATQLAPRFRARGLQPVDASRVSTGLAYPQFFDWVAKIKEAILKARVDAVIVFLGANDTFDMYDGPRQIAVGSPAWQRLYSSRVEEIAAFAKQRNVPLIWLGMPAMNRRDIQPYVPMMNRIYASAVRRHGGVYIPTGSILGETDQIYTPVKIVKGERLMVRADDGVHFSPIGWSLVAEAVTQKISFQ